MGKIFDLDSPLMTFLSKMADLIWLNILTLVCCIPIVTAGAAFSALHYTCLKMVRNSGSYVTKDFFKSFKENFKQSTIIWLIYLVIGVLLGYDLFLYFTGSLKETKMSGIVLAGVIIAFVLLLFSLAFVFPMQMHFINNIKTTIKNSLIMSITYLPRTILIIVMWFVPFGVWYGIETVLPQAGGIILLVWLYWFSLPAYVAAKLYNKPFKRFEPDDGSENDDFTWSVDSDLEEADKEASEISEEVPEISEGFSENTDEDTKETSDDAEGV